MCSVKLKLNYLTFNFQTEIRWNTLLYMLDSVASNIDVIKKVKLEGDYDDEKIPGITKTDLSEINNFVRILKQFEHLTDFFSGNLIIYLFSLI